MGDRLRCSQGIGDKGDTLFVTDIDRLLAVDVESGKITGKWAAEGAQFLNDPAVDEAGRVFASDMLANRIYVLRMMLSPSGLRARSCCTRTAYASKMDASSSLAGVATSSRIFRRRHPVI